jgi:hypothetical protein
MLPGDAMNSMNYSKTTFNPHFYSSSMNKDLTSLKKNENRLEN